MTVDQLITALQEGRDEGRWTGETPVKMCVEYPYHVSIDSVERSEPSITGDCVALS
jgi:hypothetical protein